MPESLTTFFWDTATTHPDLPAIIYSDDEQSQTVTYYELGREVSRVGELLAQHDPPALPPHGKQDVLQGELLLDTALQKGSSLLQANTDAQNNNSVIGIFCSGPSAVVCILGAMEKGSYWYISPQYTQREVTTLVKRICPRWILVEESLLSNLEQANTMVLDTFFILETRFKLVCLENIGEPLFQSCHEVRDLAYVIPTSGSTGVPKCVYVPHSCITPNIRDLVALFGASSEDRVFCAAPFTFDPSVIDLFLAFFVGAGLVMVPPSLLQTPRYLLEILLQHKVTILQATPTLLLSLGQRRLRETLLSQDSQLKVLALGGETFPRVPVLRECIGEGCQVRIFNLYGLTEVSCWATVEEVPAVRLREAARERHSCPTIDMIPIGSPLSLTEVRVISKTGKEVKNGEEGEIYVGGPKRICWVDWGNGRVRENWACHRPTGDRGLVKDGHIYCLGRLDSLVKRHGQGVSVAEIENVCGNFRYVSQCCIIQHAKGSLVAFVCPNNRGTVVGDVWRDLRSNLSPWKLPDEVVLVDAFPFNSHGKVDTHRLLSLSSQIPPRHCHSHSLRDFFEDLWRQTLGCEVAKGSDHFTKCGGNSFTALQFTMKIQEFLGFEIPVLLDMLLHNSYEETFQVARKHQLSRKSPESDSNSSKRHKPLQKRYSKAGPRTDSPQEDIGKDQLFHDENNEQKLIVTKQTATVKEQKATLKKQNSEMQSCKIEATEYCTRAHQQNSMAVTSVSRRGVQQQRGTAPLLYSSNLSPCSGVLSWKYNLSKCIDSSPLLIEHEDGRVLVFAGSHSHRFACISASSGVEIWCLTLGDRVESSPCISPDGSHVYVGCYDQHLYCIKVRDGSVAWRYKAGGEVKSSPVVDKETGCVVFGCHGQLLHCVEPTGEARWVCRVSSGSVFSSPLIARGTVIMATLGGAVCGVDKENGRLQWRVEVHSPVFSSLALHSQGVVFGTARGRVLSYSLTGAPLWQHVTEGSVFSSPFVLRFNKGLEVIAIGSHDNSVYFLNVHGELLMRHTTSSPVYATPFLYPSEHGLAFGAVICETAGKLCILSVRLNDRVGESEGDQSPEALVEKLWEQKFAGELFASPILFKDRLYVGCRDDFLYCFNLVPEQSGV